MDRCAWEGVQRGRAGRGLRASVDTATAPLIGKIFDEAGERLAPTYAVKNGRRYSYYVSRSLLVGTAADARYAWRIPARQIEEVIAVGIADLLDDRPEIARELDEAGFAADRLPAIFDAAATLRGQLLSAVERSPALAQFVLRVTLGRDRLKIIVSLAPLLGDNVTMTGQKELTIEREVPLRIRRRGVEMKLLVDGCDRQVAAPDLILIKEVVRARRCVDTLLSGHAKNLAALASREGVSDRYISSLIPLAFLAPEIVEAIVAGHQPAELTAHRLIRHIDLPIDWSGQKQLLGIR